MAVYTINPHPEPFMFASFPNGDPIWQIVEPQTDFVAEPWGLQFGFDPVYPSGLPSSTYGLINIIGTGLTYSGSSLTGGVVTGITWTSSDGASLWESITGVSYTITSSLDISGLWHAILAGNDTVIANNPNSFFLSGESGNDTAIGGVARDYLSGGPGDDVVYGEDGSDSLGGNSGNDIVYGGNGNDSESGGAGNDILLGEAGADYITGDAGKDVIYGGLGNDQLWGDTPGWNLYGGDGGDADVIHGDAGNDTIDGGSGADQLYGDDGNDLIYATLGFAFTATTDADSLYGGNGDDTLDGGAGNDLLYGGSGTNIFILSGGNDTAFGDPLAQNTALFAAPLSAFQISRGSGNSFILTDTRPGSPLGSAALIGVNTLQFSDQTLSLVTLGTSLAETLTAPSYGGWLEGLDGDDTLNGSSEGDTLSGGAGNDTLNGDGGLDLAVGRNWQSSHLSHQPGRHRARAWHGSAQFDRGVGRRRLQRRICRYDRPEHFLSQRRQRLRLCPRWRRHRLWRRRPRCVARRRRQRCPLWRRRLQLPVRWRWR
ncbi:calcium-binding protein [Bradyrhizobium sp. 2S1]|nr:calcium-binding protein [Bradyrhizobium sp. 2S1]MCK7668866.1 hypothetical protein [Bradyrhizobium sp. 2S1]